MTHISPYFACPDEKHWNKGHFWKYWVLKKEFLLNKPCCGPRSLGEHHWVNFRHFGDLSPGVRPFPPKFPSVQNNEYFRDLHSYRGSYVLMRERQGKNKFSRLTSSKYCCFKKKGASIHLLLLVKQINTQKSSPGCWFKITTLKCEYHENDTKQKRKMNKISSNLWLFQNSNQNNWISIKISKFQKAKDSKFH